MPKIQPYESQIAIPGAGGGREVSSSDIGGDIGSAAAQLGQSFQQLGGAFKEREDRQAMAEVSDLRARMITARASLTTTLQNETDAAVPGDREFAFKFMNRASKVVDDMGLNVSSEEGRRAYRTLSASLIGDLYVQANANQAHLNAQKAVLNVNVALDQARNALLNNPLQFDALANEVDVMIREQTDMPAIKRQELGVVATKALALSAMQGVIKLDGATAKGMLLDPKSKFQKYLDADSKATLLAQSDEAIRARRIEEEHARAEAERVAKLERGELMKQHFSRFADHKLTVADVTNDTKITFEEKHTLYNMIEQQSKEAKEPVRTSPAAFSAMLKRIRSGDIVNELDIERRYTDHRDISWEDIQHLRKEYEDMRSPDGRRLAQEKEKFINAVTPQIDKSNLMMGFIDQTGKEQLYKLQYFMDRKVQEYRDARKDVHLLFDPGSPDYLGHSLHLFQKTLEESARELEKAPKPKVTEKPRAKTPEPEVKRGPTVVIPQEVAIPPDMKRKPGESIFDYDKRIRGYNKQ